MEVEILGKILEVVSQPIQGAFEPDYEAFYNELDNKSVKLNVDGLLWKLAAHEDLINRNQVMFILRSKPNESVYSSYGLEFKVDIEDMKFYKVHIDHINQLVINGFVNYPRIQMMFVNYVNGLKWHKKAST